MHVPALAYFPEPQNRLIKSTECLVIVRMTPSDPASYNASSSRPSLSSVPAFGQRATFLDDEQSFHARPFRTF